MKKHLPWKICAMLLALPISVWAQPSTNNANDNTNYNSNYTNPNYNNPNTTTSANPNSPANGAGQDWWNSRNAGSWGPHKGSDEITISGSGTSNRQLNNSLGGADLSLGNYFTDTTELVLRQTVDYSNPSPGGQEWDGSTKVALDQHVLASGPLRPFVGANFGGIYGQRVRDTWAAGLEGGAKFYTMPQTFLFAELEYDWFFRHAEHALGSKFNDGEWNWSLGIGFNL